MGLHTLGEDPVKFLEAAMVYQVFQVLLPQRNVELKLPGGTIVQVHHTLLHGMISQMALLLPSVHDVLLPHTLRPYPIELLLELDGVQEK